MMAYSIENIEETGPYSIEYIQATVGDPTPEHEALREKIKTTFLNISKTTGKTEEEFCKEFQHTNTCVGYTNEEAVESILAKMLENNL